jgi:U3 small nucleolar RNA-associated protein 3
MGKKRKASGRNAQPTGPREVDPADARLGPINSYEDVANSEDEYFLGRDKLMLEDGPGSKRQKRADDDIELSDEEILAHDDDSEEDNEDDNAEDIKQLTKSKKPRGSRRDASSDEEGDKNGEEEDLGWWGSSKKEYYNADNIETEADALEEEAEAKRLQKKKLSKMTDEDFMFDENAWATGDQDDEAEEQTVTEVLQDVEVTDDMNPEERRSLLQSRYPEFEHLVNELQTLQPQLVRLKEQAQNTSASPLHKIQYRVLGCYLAALASYFALLSSPARDQSKSPKPLNPSELRDHEIMEMLLSCRDAWRRVKDLKPSQSAEANSPLENAATDIQQQLEESANGVKPKKKKSKEDKALADKRAKKLAKAKAAEDAVADLYDLPLARRKTSKFKALAAQADDESDFGEEAALDDRTAADKAARKKTLKFYTSQIALKANKRADASRDAGGDMDIPYRERLKDKQNRLLAQAEKRGQKNSKRGADLGDDSDEEDAAAASALRNDESEYYDMVANSSRQKKDDKAARFEAYAAASKADRVVENEEIGEDGKRKITYAIQKNKGLTPKRKKEQRNSRVKKRNQYEAKKKKLASMKPVWKGGEPKGGYRGELAGINTGVIKSTKL